MRTLLLMLLALASKTYVEADSKRDAVISLGAGNVATVVPSGAKKPPKTIYASTALQRRPVPTNDWWSSVSWMKFSERQYPHPLAVRADARGLRVYYPGKRIFANKTAIIAPMPGRSGDLMLGHSNVAAFPNARVDSFSDWFVSVKFATGDRSMTVSYAHGSPFVFSRYSGGQPTVAFPVTPRLWHGDAKSPVLGITMKGSHYGLFAPKGAEWSGLSSRNWTCRTDKTYFSVGLLPDAKPSTLALFQKYAYSHVKDTRVTWSYEQSTSVVTTKFRASFDVKEGNTEATLFALYPHQWRNSKSRMLDGGYASVRGRMKLVEGDSFETRMRFPGVLPCLPNVGGCDKLRMKKFLRTEIERKPPAAKDTYWEGKHFGKLATLLSLAEQYSLNDGAEKLESQIRTRLESWFRARNVDGSPKKRTLFYYDKRWGTLIGYPSSYGSADELNDHHFHYGYFIRAAAEVALREPEWSSSKKWGEVTRWLIRDIASADRKDPRFPFLRNFDPYAGHSWASGHAKFGDGNNIESSSEAMNAWTAIILWGIATDDRKTRDLGIYLYTTELAAIEEYWFDVHNSNHPKTYSPSVVTMVWGGKGANETWFSKKPEMIHGINWLPIHGGSLYLGRFPAYAKKNYDALLRENGDTNWSAWADLIWMYRALSDPQDALKQFNDGVDRMPTEAGNSIPNTYHWISSLQKLGGVDRHVQADHPLAAVFRNGNSRTYVVYSRSARKRKVRFTDGVIVDAQRKGFTLLRKPDSPDTPRN